MRLYIFMGVILALLILLIYIKFKKGEPLQKLWHYIAAICVAIFFTYISKTIFVHKPIFILHLALLVLSWGSVFYYIFKDRLILWFLLSPLASTLFFFVEAIFFREHG